MLHEDRSSLASTAWDVLLTTYDVLRIEHRRLRLCRFRVFVADEAHRLKNAQSVTSRAALGLRSELRVALTGTPLQNNLVELWVGVRVLAPR